MDNSFCSYPNKVLPDSNGEASLPEESGWTQYLEDFSSYNRQTEEEQEENSKNSASLIGASLVSDAGSGPEWKNRIETSLVNGSLTLPRKLSFVNRRINREIPFDESLEDTASSPVNSPKIAMSFRGMDINPRKTDENFHGDRGKGDACDYRRDMKKKEGHDLHDNGKNDVCTELKNKGLCLVPVSMFVNYVD
ncbi:hypothetical protein Nepgr_000516 [Nepenthes gracilis]|uniref:Uncharacterized protein n=1 Tax=Nepenthes gracilis TaxID=150966 RepID=A0AAD3P3Y1_NEPGR|nr:hypothetical protein Nepgr_000516 [Nepenthes gracilis]